MLDLLDYKTLPEAIKLLQELIEMHGSAAYFEVKKLSYFDSSETTLNLEALETDGECRHREEQETAIVEANKKYELEKAKKTMEKQRKLYEKLKKEFESDKDES